MPSYTERVILSKPNDFNNIPNNAGSGGVVSSNVTETINNVTVNGSNISIFNQEFLDTTSAILTWTQNSGKLPTTNLLAAIHVYQNGQKLVDSQYSITLPDTITIDSNTHYDGKLHCICNKYKLMEIPTPKKERKFLKSIGRIAGVLAQELVLGLGRKYIGKMINKIKIPKKRETLSFLLLLSCTFAFAQYPATGNKQRLGYQTTGDGLVFRGRSNDTTALKPSTINNAYHLFDTVNNVLFSYIKTKGGWQFNNSDTVIIQGATMPFDSITFNTAKDGTVGVGEVEYNDSQGSLIQGLKGGNVTNVIGQQLHQRVSNVTGSTLSKGTAVYLSGSQGNRITAAKALATSDPTSANTFGIVAESIADNASGYVITEGLITGINTSGLTEDSAVYLSPTFAGGLTSTKPQAPNHGVYIGVCVKTNAGSGELFVKIKNGLELDELHDVLITSPASNASLYYKSSEGIWRDTTAALLVSDTASMLTNYLRSGVAASTYQTKLNGTGFVKASGTTITYDNSTYLTSSTGVTTFSAGTTGFTPSSATSGAVTLAGTLAIANGGTGATSASAARTALGATVRGANTFTLTDIGAISFLRYNADNTVSQRAADGMRTDLGGTTIGQSMFTLTNPSAITFPRFNADNTVSALSAADFRTAIGAGTGNGNGTVTSVTGSLPISSSGGTTPNITIANASTTASGVVTTSTQSMAGNKTFTGDLATSGAFSATGFTTLTGGASVGTMATTSSLTHILGVNSSNAIGEIALGSGFSLSSGTINLGGFTLVSLDFPSTSAQSSSDLTVSYTGAATSHPVILAVPDGSAPANTNYTAWVSATNTVKVRFNNYSSASVNPSSGTFTIFVLNL